jgi:catechol 2,3-dioxygenase-like lactoylglutathione lyase family enzyme
MMKLDHLRIPVTDLGRSRDWYTKTLGLKVEFEVPERQTVALQDTDDFALFLQEGPSPVQPSGCALWFQVPDVDATFAEWSARGVEFAHGPRKSYWGLRRGICGGPPGNSSGQLPRGRGDGQLSDNPFGREWRNWQTRWT